MTKRELCLAKENLSPATVQAYGEIESAMEPDNLGIATGQLIMPRSYGLFLEDIQRIDFITGAFYASGKIYVHKLNVSTLWDLYSDDNIKRIFPRVIKPDAFDHRNRSGYYSSLPSALKSIWSEKTYPVCNFAAHRSESLLTKDEYESQTVSFTNSATSVQPVYHEKDGTQYLRHLEFRYVNFHFTPLRSQWPFQPQRLIIALSAGTTGGSTLAMKSACVSKPWTAFADPMWSWMTSASPKLSLRVNITNMGSPEVTNRYQQSTDYFPVNHPCKGDQCDDTRSIQDSGIFFSFLYYPPFTEGFFQTVPVLISSLATLINFFTPHDTKDIVAAMLLLTGALAAHTQASGNQMRNVIDHSFTIIDTMAFVNYFITITYIITVVTVKSLLRSGEKHKALVFYKFMKMFSLSFSLMYICPFVSLFGYQVVASDFTYEEQVLVTDAMSWGTVLPLIFAIQITYALSLRRKHIKEQLEQHRRLHDLEYNVDIQEFEQSDVLLWVLKSPAFLDRFGNPLDYNRRKQIAERLSSALADGTDLLPENSFALPGSLRFILQQAMEKRGSFPKDQPFFMLQERDEYRRPLLNYSVTVQEQTNMATGTFETSQ